MTRLPGSKRTLLAFILTWLLLAAAPAAADKLQGRVSWVYDGDTIKVAHVGKVRLLGIDVPEREASRRDRYFRRWHVPPATLRRIHARALQRAIELSYHKTVTLETDRETHDAYGRLLAYVTLPGGRMLNRVLLEEGYAVVYRRFDFRLKEDFLRAEQKARRAGMGLWGKDSDE